MLFRSCFASFELSYSKTPLLSQLTFRETEARHLLRAIPPGRVTGTPLYIVTWRRQRLEDSSKDYIHYKIGEKIDFSNSDAWLCPKACVERQTYAYILFS